MVFIHVRKKYVICRIKIESSSPIGSVIYIPSSTFYLVIVTTANYDRVMNTSSNEKDDSIANTPHPSTTQIVMIPLSFPIANNRSVKSLTSFNSSSSFDLPITTNAVSILRLPPTNATATADEDDPFTVVRIVHSEWHQCLQDVGCAKDALQNKRYKRGQILSTGPHAMELYYYRIASIVID